jgi:polysaccharide pyruvyl transferase WcaK-like protein
VLTEGILKNAGFNNVTMTGCPVWYSLPDIGKRTHRTEVKHVVVTTPAGGHLWKQSNEVLKVVKRTFPNAKITYSFHRGIFPGPKTPLRQGLSYVLMSALGILNGAKVVDVSYDLSKIDFYDDCDLHVGYRVHAHLYFLSKRLPSVLINEDGRGLGMTESLGQEDLNINQKDLLSKLETLLQKHRAEKFSWFENVYAKIDAHFSVMKSFLAEIKNL